MVLTNRAVAPTQYSPIFQISSEKSERFSNKKKDGRYMSLWMIPLRGGQAKKAGVSDSGESGLVRLRPDHTFCLLLFRIFTSLSHCLSPSHSLFTQSTRHSKHDTCIEGFTPPPEPLLVPGGRSSCTGGGPGQ